MKNKMIEFGAAIALPRVKDIILAATDIDFKFTGTGAQLTISIGIGKAKLVNTLEFKYGGK